MSEPDGRYGDAASTGSPLPGQPLADRSTEVVEPDVRYDTVVSRPLVPPSRPAADEAAWRRSVPWQRDGGLHDGLDDGPSTRPRYRDAPVMVRRADTLAGLLLLFAGMAAGVSLLVVWVHGGSTGLDLVRDGTDDFSADVQALVDRDAWTPLAIVYGGAALFVLGLLAFVPGKTHRLLGALALLVSLVVAAGVLVPLAGANWDLDRWAVGAWFTVAVGGLGFLGALKALATGPSTWRSGRTA